MGGNFGRKALTGAALLALAAASACSRKPEPPSSAPVAASSGQPAPASSAPPPPLSFLQTTPAASVALNLPAALTREPELHRRLYNAEVKDLKAFSDSAKAEFAEMGVSASGALPSEKREDWSVAADTSKLLSLRSLIYEFDTGGAHPNLVYGAILWDKALKRPITLVSLFKPGAGLAPVEAALCDGFKVERRQRFGAAASAVGDTASGCPRLDETPFQLTPSTAPGKAAGLTFLVSPYALGSMAEGPYEITVPRSAFASLLSPAYADEFAGKPEAPKASSQPAADSALAPASPTP
jgi:hypothetical protein